MAEQERQPERTTGSILARIAITVLRVIALFVGGGFLLFGLMLSVGFAIGFGWSGNFERAWIAIAMLVYLFGVALLSLVYAVWPKHTLGALLLLLCLPAVWAYHQSRTQIGHLRELGEAYSRTADTDAGAAAREQLEAIGRRAGPQPHVKALIDELARAEDDATRIRIVELLGKLSYQYEPALNALRRLHSETQADPGREKLHDTVIEAIQGINPYEPMFGADGNLDLRDARAAETEFAERLLAEFFDRVDDEVAAMARGVPQLSDWERSVGGTDWIRGGKYRTESQLRYSRTWEGAGAGGGTCRIDVIASPATRPVSVPDAYRSKTIEFDVATYRLAASAITDQPESTELEARILEAVRSAAAAADLAWSARPELPAGSPG